MKLLERIRQQKLMSTTLVLFTLSVGILIGTLVNTRVNAARGQTAAPDATPLAVPKPVAIGNEFSALAKKLESSVVNISVEVSAPTGRAGQGQSPNDDDLDLFERFFGQPNPGGQGAPQPRRRQQGGTGFVVDKNGYIITNHHVVDGGEKIKVKLHGDLNDYRARVIGKDPETDLAVIKIDPGKPLVPVSIGNSDAVQVGDWAVAIGSPFGLEATVTAGIVSATGRSDIGPGQFQRFIQTDAAINPGNSGGPLLNIRGEVIGVNTMIATRNGGSEGVGFSLPVNMVVRVYNDIIREGRVVRGSIGVSWQRNTTPVTLKALGVDHGVVVDAVTPDGPAEKAGVRRDDIIVGINGKSIQDGDDLMARVADTPVGDQVTLNVDRGGKKMDLRLTIRDRMEVFKTDPRVVGENFAPAESSKAEPTDVKFGIQVRALSEQERDQVPDKRGVKVARVEQDSFAEEIGVEENDVITSINRQPVNSTEDVRRAAQALKPGDAVAFRVLRFVQASGVRGARGKASAPDEPRSMYLSGTLPQN
jgi:serine protease Do